MKKIIKNNYKNILFALTLLVGLFSFGKSIDALTQASQLDFENNVIDPYEWSIVTWSDGQTLSECTGAQYVSGRTGLAIRTSHNNDEGCEDLIINGNSYGDTFFASDEIYYSYWMKFEAEYENTSNNVKTIWEGVPGSGFGHQEGAWSGPSGGIISHRWQWSGDGTGWDAGTDVTKYSGNIPYNAGDWMHIEFYIKLSTGTDHMNADGEAYFKVNEITYISDQDIITGEMGRLALPGINGTSDQATGHGWWQIDDYEVWDGEPLTDIIPPSAPSGLSVS